MIHSVSHSFTGNSTGNIGSKIRGRILAIKVVADANATNNFDLTLTGGDTGIPILTDTTVANNATTWFHPRALATKHTDGSDATDAFVEIPVVNEPVAVTIANAGTTGIITITVIYDTYQ